MKTHLLKAVATALAVPALIWFWRALYAAPCAALFVPLLGAVLLTMSFREALIMRRRMWSSWYLDRDSGLWIWAKRHTLLNIISVCLGVFFSSALFFSAINWGRAELLAMLIDAALLVLVYRFLLVKLAWAGVRDDVLPALAKSWTTLINVPLMLIVLVVVTLNTPPPEFLVVDSWLETLTRASSGVASECGYTDGLTRFLAEKDALGWWLMIRGGGELQNPLLHGLAWLVFLISGGITWIAFSRLCVQLFDLQRVFKEME